MVVHKAHRMLLGTQLGDEESAGVWLVYISVEHLENVPSFLF